jgi:hypothetical protein
MENLKLIVRFLVEQSYRARKDARRARPKFWGDYNSRTSFLLQAMGETILAGTMMRKQNVWMSLRD